MMQDTLPAVDIEALFEEDIPCGGVSLLNITCDKSAQLRGQGHGCHSRDDLGYFKCIPCWQKWLAKVLTTMANHGVVTCSECQQTFSNVQDFSDYRPF